MLGMLSGAEHLSIFRILVVAGGGDALKVGLGPNGDTVPKNNYKTCTLGVEAPPSPNGRVHGP